MGHIATSPGVDSSRGVPESRTPGLTLLARRELECDHIATLQLPEKTKHGDYLPLANKYKASKDPAVMLVCEIPLYFLGEENCSARPSSIRNTVSTP